MKRIMCLAALAAVFVLAATDTAQAQRRGGGGRGGWEGGRGWDGGYGGWNGGYGGWNRGYGYGSGYGYGYPYSGGYYGGYNPYRNYRYGYGYPTTDSYYTYPSTNYDYGTFDFDRDTRLVERWSKLADAKDPDLSAFRRSGGKLLITHGWADAILQPALDDPSKAAGRPWIARALVAAGHVADTSEAFDRWLTRGRPALARTRARSTRPTSARPT